MILTLAPLRPAGRTCCSGKSLCFRRSPTGLRSIRGFAGRSGDALPMMILVRPTPSVAPYDPHARFCIQVDTSTSACWWWWTKTNLPSLVRRAAICPPCDLTTRAHRDALRSPRSMSTIPVSINDEVVTPRFDVECPDSRQFVAALHVNGARVVVGVLA